MKRRAFVSLVVAAGVAGCADVEGEGSVEFATDSPSPTPEGAVVAAETLYDDAEYPVDLDAGDVLTFDVDVERGGPVVVVVINHDTADELVRERVDTRRTFEVEVEADGVHRIHVVNNDRTVVRIRHRKA